MQLVRGFYQWKGFKVMMDLQIYGRVKAGIASYLSPIFAQCTPENERE